MSCLFDFAIVVFDDRLTDCFAVQNVLYCNSRSATSTRTIHTAHCTSYGTCNTLYNLIVIRNSSSASDTTY